MTNIFTHHLSYSMQVNCLLFWDGCLGVAHLPVTTYTHTCSFSIYTFSINLLCVCCLWLLCSYSSPDSVCMSRYLYSNPLTSIPEAVFQNLTSIQILWAAAVLHLPSFQMTLTVERVCGVLSARIWMFWVIYLLSFHQIPKCSFVIGVCSDDSIACTETSTTCSWIHFLRVYSRASRHF